MPELPDIEVYIACLDKRVRGAVLEGVRLASPFFLRTSRRCRPPPGAGWRLFRAWESASSSACKGAPPGPPPDDRGTSALAGARRGGAEEAWAGGVRFSRRVPGRHRSGLAPAGVFARGRGRGRARRPRSWRDRGLRRGRGGFPRSARAREPHPETGLTDPRLFSGIGNAYSDEILHRARLSPLAWTGRLADDEVARLFEATRGTLAEWTARLGADAGDGFPETVHAIVFRKAVRRFTCF